MAHFAEIDENNLVINVISVHNNELIDDQGNESEQKGVDFCKSLFGGVWVQTSYNNNFRGVYAGIGFSYDPLLDIFVAPELQELLINAEEVNNGDEL
jgi:hypothetical protein